MLFYRAQLEGLPAEILSISLSPVRSLLPGHSARLQAGGGRVRVTLRYTVGTDGAVFTHRGWLFVAQAPGRRLRVLGYHYDGAAVLLSLGLLPVQAGGSERVTLRFDLPLRLESWGVTAATGAAVRLSCSCAAVQGGLVLRGRAQLQLETPGQRLCPTVHFSRFAAAEIDTQLTWRAYGQVEALDCRIGPDGVIEGRLRVAVMCQGRPPRHDAGRVGTVAGADAVASVRQVSAQVARVQADFVSEGQALLSGMLAVEVAWADRSGRGRWTSSMATFSAMLSIPGLAEGDRLEPVAQVERLTPLEERAFLHLAVGLTALRPQHLPLEGGWYRVDRVIGQAVAVVDVVQPLFPEVGEPPAPMTAELLPPLASELELDGPWTAIRARVRRRGDGRAPVVEVWAQRDVGGKQGAVFWQRVRLGSAGRASGAGWQTALGIQVVRCREVLVRPRELRADGAEVSTYRGDGQPAAVWLELPEPAWAVLGVDVVRVRGGWALRCLVRCHSGMRLVTQVVDGAGAEPLAVMAMGMGAEGVERVCVEVTWPAG